MKISLLPLSFLLVLLFVGLVFTTSCSRPAPEAEKAEDERSFSGTTDAVALANRMFEAIGGKEGWCELNSLYIKARHTQPEMTIPYQSEIWRATDQFLVVIEQQNDSFHVKGVLDETEGRIRYYDKRDTMRVLTEEQLAGWKFDHDHNIYVLLHNLGCNPDKYRVEIGGTDSLAFYSDTTYMVSFRLDDKLRPYLFYVPKLDGSIAGSNFEKWHTDSGLVHSAGGYPLDSSFRYSTEIWHPSGMSMKEAFGKDVVDLE